MIKILHITKNLESHQCYQEQRKENANFIDAYSRLTTELSLMNISGRIWYLLSI